MKYLLKNKTNQPIVCTLADNESLILMSGKDVIITENQYIPYLDVLCKKELILVEPIKVETKEKKVTKSVEKVKEEK